MADHHRHHQRPHRLSVPPRAATFTANRPSYPLYPSTPTPTPSKLRLSSSLSHKSSNRSSASSSLSSLFILLFSLRSLYTLLPFLRSSPSSFSLFPFSFLVSLLSFLLSLTFSFFSLSTNRFGRKQTRPVFDLGSVTKTQNRILVSKSVLLAVVFLLRFQALRYCGTAAMILAELSGNVCARFVAEFRKWGTNGGRGVKVRGVLALGLGLFLLSVSWDRVDCFPLSRGRWGFLGIGREGCVRIWPMLLPFLSGFLGSYEKVSMNVGGIRELGMKRVRLISLFYTTIALFVPAVFSMLVFEVYGEDVSVKDLVWPLANTVLFGVLLSENYDDEKGSGSKDFQQEYMVTFVFMVFWELFYFPELSLCGLLLCGLLIYIGMRELDSVYSNYYELGFEPSESYISLVMKPVRHIMSERKSRKIALFLLINAGYMVVEFVAGFMSNSLGLISDACHMLFDCAALAIGLYASYISRLPANDQYNYGRGRFEVLSGYVNAVFLVLVGALIVLESIERILEPQDISTSSLLVVSIGGLLVNVIGLIFFHEEHHHAHGGSCSHSHSHSHTHSDSHHHHQGCHHGHESHAEHTNGSAVPHNCSEKSSSDHKHCEHHHHGHSDGADACRGHNGVTETRSDNHHDHTHHHGHFDHVHQHGDLDHHNNSHQHSHNDCHQRHVAHNVHDSSNAYSGSAGDHSHSHVAGSLPHGHCSDSHLEELSGGKELQKQKHHHIDHNMEGIFLHVLADTMGSVGVVISTLLIKYKGWLVADPASSIFISVLIISSVIPLLKNSVEVLLQRVPRAYEKDLREALRDIVKINGVRAIQNFHVWSFTNADVVGTLHLHISNDIDKGSAKSEVSHILHDAGIKDLTLQVECVE